MNNETKANYLDKLISNGKLSLERIIDFGDGDLLAYTINFFYSPNEEQEKLLEGWIPNHNKWMPIYQFEAMMKSIKLDSLTISSLLKFAATLSSCSSPKKVEAIIRGIIKSKEFSKECYFENIEALKSYSFLVKKHHPEYLEEYGMKLALEAVGSSSDKIENQIALVKNNTIPKLKRPFSVPIEKLKENFDCFDWNYIFERSMPIKKTEEMKALCVEHFKDIYKGVYYGEKSNFLINFLSTFHSTLTEADAIEICNAIASDRGVQNYQLLNYSKNWDGSYKAVIRNAMYEYKTMGQLSGYDTRSYLESCDPFSIVTNAAAVTILLFTYIDALKEAKNRSEEFKKFIQEFQNMFSASSKFDDKSHRTAIPGIEEKEFQFQTSVEDIADHIPYSATIKIIDAFHSRKNSMAYLVNELIFREQVKSN